MATSNVPVRVPERPRDDRDSVPASGVWRQEKKPTRFVIKLGGLVPC